MFDIPSKTTAFVAPAQPIDVDQRYIFKVINLEDKGVSKWADPAKNETFHEIAWTFNVAFADSRQPLFDVDGNTWEYVESSTSKMGKNPKNGRVAKSRIWIEAFLGHPIEDDEITPDLPSMLLNKYAVGFFHETEKESQTGERYTRLEIMRLSPFKAGAKPEPKPEPKPKAEEPVAAGDLPF